MIAELLHSEFIIVIAVGILSAAMMLRERLTGTAPPKRAWDDIEHDGLW